MEPCRRRKPHAGQSGEDGPVPRQRLPSVCRDTQHFGRRMRTSPSPGRAPLALTLRERRDGEVILRKRCSPVSTRSSLLKTKLFDQNHLTPRSVAAITTHNNKCRRGRGRRRWGRELVGREAGRGGRCGNSPGLLEPWARSCGCSRANPSSLFRSRLIAESPVPGFPQGSEDAKQSRVFLARGRTPRFCGDACWPVTPVSVHRPLGGFRWQAVPL